MVEVDDGAITLNPVEYLHVTVEEQFGSIAHLLQLTGEVLKYCDAVAFK